MGNWVNLRLLVTGRPSDVKRFRLAAGPLKGRINAEDSSVFTADMECGETGDLEADGITPFCGTFRTASFRFQGKSNDYVDHFQTLSRRFPRLAFVLLFSDPNAGVHGSHLLRNGRRRSWRVPRRNTERILNRRMAEEGITLEQAYVSEEAQEKLFWIQEQAYWEMLDIADAHWNAEVRAWLCSMNPHFARSAPKRTRPAVGALRSRR